MFSGKYRKFLVSFFKVIEGDAKFMRHEASDNPKKTHNLELPFSLSRRFFLLFRELLSLGQRCDDFYLIAVRYIWICLDFVYSRSGFLSDRLNQSNSCGIIALPLKLPIGISNRLHRSADDVSKLIESAVFYKPLAIS